MDEVLSNLQFHPRGINKNVKNYKTNVFVNTWNYCNVETIYNTVQMFGVGKIFIKKSFQSLVSYAPQRLHLFDQMK